MISKVTNYTIRHKQMFGTWKKYTFRNANKVKDHMVLAGDGALEIDSGFCIAMLL